MHNILTLNELIDMETYTLSKIPSCKPIIIPIKVKDCCFDQTSIDADTKTLKDTFKQLGFAKPEVFNQDSDRDTILTQLLKISRKSEFTVDRDFLLCVIISYCDRMNGCFKDVNRVDISVDEVIHIFNTENCIGLRGKPKIFILQTDDISISPRDPSLFGKGSEEETRLPTQADSLIYHCSIRGSIEQLDWSDSVKQENKWNTAQGSKFIHTFCNEIRKERGTDIHQLTFKVNSAMKEYVDDINSRKLKEDELSKHLELPICTSQLLRKFTLCQRQKETEV
ncbi:caspase-2-like isoform X1 [Mytilus californianus]|uniref:caspase-2-like isoform X1 n=2 Tax=Mytilus californianus TaxID=6549 RepID=UPI002248414F|nr:caspase-2-like isoform X1 [Mytilus californianus]